MAKTFKDFNSITGKSLTFYSREYHIDSCDSFTRDYLSSEGVLQSDNEATPADPYTRSREIREADQTARVKPMVFERHSEAEKQDEMAWTKDNKGKLRKYLENDGKVLR